MHSTTGSPSWAVELAEASEPLGSGGWGCILGLAAGQGTPGKQTDSQQQSELFHRTTPYSYHTSMQNIFIEEVYHFHKGMSM